MKPAWDRNTKMGRPPTDDEWMQIVGHFSNVEEGRKAMGIDWMTRDELSEAIPPAYTEFIGKQLMCEVRDERTWQAEMTEWAASDV